MNKDLFYALSLGFFVYLGIFLYLKIFLKYTLTEDGIEISIFGIQNEFIRFDDMLLVSLTSMPVSDLQKFTYFKGLRLPILGIRIISDRNNNYGFNRRYTGIVIFPWDTVNYYHKILEKIKIQQ